MSAHTHFYTLQQKEQKKLLISPLSYFKNLKRSTPEFLPAIRRECFIRLLPVRYTEAACSNRSSSRRKACLLDGGPGEASLAAAAAAVTCSFGIAGSASPTDRLAQSVRVLAPLPTLCVCFILRCGGRRGRPR